MKKLNVNLENAKKLHGKMIEDVESGIEYYFDAVTIKGGNQEFLVELNVDAYDSNDEWLHEYSCSYQANEVLNSNEDSWINFI